MFDKTGKEATKLFSEEVQRILRKTDTGKEKVQVIFLDKNFPISGLSHITSHINKNKPKTVTFKKLYLVPKITDPLPKYPLSSSMLMQCYYRLKNREVHQTFDNKDEVLTVQLLFMFFNLFVGEKLDNRLLTDYSLDGFFRIQMTVPE